jgi:hypothetical protein
VLLVVVGPVAQPTALLSPSSDGKPEAATTVVIAPDDGHEDARNMLCCLDIWLAVHHSITYLLFPT